MREQGYANAQELAEASGMPYNTLYRWASGRANPHRRNLVALLRALGLDPGEYGLRTPPGGITAGDEPPAWFVDFESKLFHRLEVQAEQQQRILDELAVLRRRGA